MTDLTIDDHTLPYRLALNPPLSPPTRPKHHKPIRRFAETVEQVIRSGSHVNQYANGHRYERQHACKSHGVYTAWRLQDGAAGRSLIVTPQD